MSDQFMNEDEYDQLMKDWTGKVQEKNEQYQGSKT